MFGDDEGPSVLYVQILLDRARFSPGVLDGKWGKNTEKAVVWYVPLEHYDEAAVAKHLKAGADEPLARARELLAALPAWTVEGVGQALHDAAAALELGMGKVAQPLRVAITGTQVSPDISHTVYLAGRDEALKRIDAALIKIPKD